MTRTDQLIEYVYRMRDPDVVTPDEERQLRTIAGLIEAEAAASDAGLREALERMVNQWSPDSTNPALDNARAVLAAHRSSECPSCDDSWAAHVAGLHDEV